MGTKQPSVGSTETSRANTHIMVKAGFCTHHFDLSFINFRFINEANNMYEM